MFWDLYISLVLCWQFQAIWMRLSSMLVSKKETYTLRFVSNGSGMYVYIVAILRQELLPAFAKFPNLL
jgi:hypothetical protein